MTQPQSFFGSENDKDLQLKMREPIVAAAMMGMLLSGCSTQTPAPSDASASSSSSSSEEAVRPMGNDGGTMMPASAMMASSQMPKGGMMSSAMMRHSAYKDGTFAADGAYTSPAGGEQISVSLTLKDGVITDATYQGMAQEGRSLMFQNAFGEGYKALVVGKSIDEVSLDVVNGSSLTPMGFMDALAKIKVEAAA